MEILSHLSLKCFSSPCVLNTQENKSYNQVLRGHPPQIETSGLDAMSAGPPVFWPLGTGLSRYRAASLLPSLGLACGSGQTSLPRSPLGEKQLVKGARVSPTGPLYSHDLEVREPVEEVCAAVVEGASHIRFSSRPRNSC